MEGEGVSLLGEEGEVFECSGAVFSSWAVVLFFGFAVS